MPFAVHNRRLFGGLALGETMTAAMAVFGIAVGSTPLICYLLMTRLQNGKRNLRSSGDSSTPDAGGHAAGDGWRPSAGEKHQSFDLPQGNFFRFIPVYIRDQFGIT
jgi:hypothetical protein